MSDIKADIQRINEAMRVLGSYFSTTFLPGYIAAVKQFEGEMNQVRWLAFAKLHNLEKDGRMWSLDKQILYVTGRFTPEQIDAIPDDDIPALTQLSSLLPWVDSLQPTADRIVDLAAEVEAEKDTDRRRSREDVQRKRQETRRKKR